MSSQESSESGNVATGQILPVLVAGGAAGMVGWFSTYPLDVVKTRLQSGESIHIYSFILFK